MNGLRDPYGLAIDAVGRVFVSENYINSITIVTPQSTATTATATIQGVSNVPIWGLEAALAGARLTRDVLHGFHGGRQERGENGVGLARCRRGLARAAGPHQRLQLARPRLAVDALFLFLCFFVWFVFMHNHPTLFYNSFYRMSLLPSQMFLF